MGGSGFLFLPSELNAAYLMAQLESPEKINGARMARWEQYHQAFEDLEKQGLLRRMHVPADCIHNAHMYYLITRSLEERTDLIAWLRERDICAVFHYIPLHSATAGLKFGRFAGEDRYTTNLSERLLRLPMYYELTESDCTRVIEAVRAFYAR